MRRELAAVALTGILLGACNDGGTAIRETVPPATSSGTPTSELAARSYSDLGFALSVPAEWQETRGTVNEGRSRVLHFDPTSGTPAKPKRAADVIVEVAALADVRRGVVEVFGKAFKEYRQVRLVDDLTVDGHAAFRHEFLAEGLRYDQWWIERKGGTFRVTFWAPIEAFPAAGALNDQIIATFRELT